MCTNKTKFRNDMLENNDRFKEIFNNLLANKEISEFPEYLKSIILRDKTPIRINHEPLAFKDLFNQNLTEGRCKTCTIEMVLLLDKLGIYSEAVECINEHFKGTTGSSYGGHWYVEVKSSMEHYCIDTSLVIIGTEEAFQKLGSKPIKKYDLDTLFKQEPSLIEYYDNMIINKTT